MNSQIQELIDRSKQDDLSPEESLGFAQSASELAKLSKNDSIILRANRNLAFTYLNNELYELFRETAQSNLRLARELPDSTSIAISLRNLAWYHYMNSVSDSTYYYYIKAEEIYQALGDKKNQAEVLLNIADIRETERDYLGSENNALQAIKIVQTLPETEDNLDTLWSLYNLLGVISYKLYNYDESNENHQRALEIAQRMRKGYPNTIFSLNNLAVNYRLQRKYEESIKIHSDIINDNQLIKVSPETYAVYLANLANTKYLSSKFDQQEILDDYWVALKMSDSLDYDYGKMTVAEYLSEFYSAKNNRDSAIFYSEQMYNLAKSSSANDVILEAMLRLSELKEGEESRKFLNEYIHLSDSLLQNERAIRNKFARIEFETDRIIAEKEQISKERLIFLLAAIGLLVTLVLVYIIISQRVKNRELRFSKMQQEANEEIYNLMLAQQDKIEEGRSKEKKRISEELHDGILGRLFGTRLSLDSLNLQNTDDAQKTRGQYIEELKSIEQEIRKISHDLNSDFISGSSFSDILRTLVENQTSAFGLSYTFEEDESIDWDELNNKTKIHIYRMLQESMQNVHKHANASHLKISFQMKKDVILLTVEDDGSGFNVQKARKGIGLKNFNSRASEIGGKVEIYSTQGEGTKVKIYAPTA